MESERVKWLTEHMRVTPPDIEGVQYVEIFGLPVGMFRRVPDSPGYWQCQHLTRRGFEEKGPWLAPAEGEHGEHWAVTEIARRIDWDEQDRSEQT
jgi:hypothetical protein